MGCFLPGVVEDQFPFELGQRREDAEQEAADCGGVDLRNPAKVTSDSDVKATTIPGKASTRRSEATLGRVIISEVDGFGQTRTAFEV